MLGRIEPILSQDELLVLTWDTGEGHPILWKKCKLLLLEHFKGTKAMTRGAWRQFTRPLDINTVDWIVEQIY